jgi:hypothetical protein
MWGAWGETGVTGVVMCNLRRERPHPRLRMAILGGFGVIAATAIATGVLVVRAYTSPALVARAPQPASPPATAATVAVPGPAPVAAAAPAVAAKPALAPAAGRRGLARRRPERAAAVAEQGPRQPNAAARTRAPGKTSPSTRDDELNRLLGL